ncbi:unnamed protein product [Brachionus calyciflorus]|uniref:ubiquitinyl hydrolase 1 n=1 Tax=Brachionus calyciflorus TaxID=104777 RepID=A0A813YLS9_9BILA|nr:unnamed protein product [Brachionus calyciflorus]
MLPNDSNKLCKKIHLNDSDNSQSSFTSSLSSSSSSTTSSSSKLSQKIRLQKSFYNKDALESVTKSLLTIDETTDQIKYNTIIKKSRTNSDSINHIQSSSLLTNHLNQSFDSAIRTNSKQALDSDLISSIKNIEPSSSCTQFLDLLLTEPTVITPSISSSSSASSPLSSSNSSINFKTLPAAKKLIKRLSIKSNSSTLQFGVKFINKVLTKNSSTQSIPADLNENKMHKPLNTDLFLPSKKLRKLLPLNQGIKNHGNTCFINCVLQSLFHSSPLLNYFLTNQFEKTTRHIQSQGYFNGKQGTQFLLSKHIYRLLASLWQNSYDSNYSAELKQVIGYLNPTFAGVNQNDSHEFCLWLLDRLNEELTYKIEDFPRGELKTNSIIEQLFKIEFKSTVTCSKCNYKSSKLETDMMLSLPLPQVDDSTPKLPRDHIYRRSLYCHLILTNENSIRKLNDEQIGNGKSKFYTDLDDRCFKVPFIAKIGINILLSKVNGKFEESDNKINPTFQDLRFYLQENFQYLNSKNLVFLQMGKINKIIRDSEQIRDVFFPNLSLETQVSSPLYIFEMNDDESLLRKYAHGDPMIKIVLFNSYDDLNLQKYNVCYGLPFAITINRDCSYSELCKMILESQSKFFKDKNINKYGVNIFFSIFRFICILYDSKSSVDTL